MPKILADTALTGRRGINVIERVLLEMGFGWHPTSGDLETGIDGIVDIRDPHTKASTNRIIQVQSKSTLGRFTSETDTSLTYLCDEDDLLHWLGGNVPIILVRVRPPDEAYWVPLKEYFADPKRRKSRRIDFDKERDRFTVAARDRLVQLAIEKAPGLVYAPVRRPETLLSNLLSVARYSSTVHVGRTELQYRDVIRAALLESLGADAIPNEWALAAPLIYSFDDLSQPYWKPIIASESVEQRSTAEFATSSNPADTNVFRELLGRALSALVHRQLLYHPGKAIYYFRPTQDLSPRIIKYRGLENASERAVFRGYGRRKEQPDQPSYYRHNAFGPRFRRLDGAWFLELCPTYHYTRDGLTDDLFYEERLKKMKRLERNGSIVGQLMMWKEILAPGPVTEDLFQKSGAPYPHLGFGSWCGFEVQAGVPDGEWIGSEDDPSRLAEVDDEKVEAGEIPDAGDDAEEDDP